MKFQVQGMTCTHCVQAIHGALRALDPDAVVTVDLAAGTVEAVGGFDPARAIAAIEAAGYRVDGRADGTDAAPACRGHCG
ncbi:heavy-metal-associated domain-containing protein [Rehaibacterium terrae]|uniref:Copper chaperone n=1 Tax=Rehaibacterium terrae TaxID=1341696 RepID=A0A7W7XYF6_9GAMM|nr:cation transporter [Rehaibacterium terrae]MBB5014632.1 copper chaperone [Rehaibacterium terrae]